MAEKKFEEVRKKEVMENVIASLNKKDSLKVLFEHYEDSLHKADHIAESPRGNRESDLITTGQAEEDSYSRVVQETQDQKNNGMGVNSMNN
jgi:hypothetical protein